MNTIRMMRQARYLSVMLAAVIALSLVGCTSARQSTPNAEGKNGVFKLATSEDAKPAPYHVEPPDEVIISAPKITDLHNNKQTVRPDGKITIPLLGDVQVAGLTPEQISAKLNELASKYYKQPDIRVEVNPNSHYYVVFGFGVNTPGKKPYTGHDTVVKALADCGFSPAGWPQQVRISRPAREGRDKATVVVDFTKVYEYADMRQNYVLEEGDIVYVPESPLTSMNENLMKFFGPITGASAGAGTINYASHPGRTY
jgi:polysaccharide export outer membrane protein